MRLEDGRGVLVVGSSGSGKTAWTLQQVKAAKRLLVWDSLGEWSRSGSVQPVRSLALLGEVVKNDVSRNTDGRLRYGYTGPAGKEHFAAFCKLAWVYLRARPRGHLVVEELADVTTPGKAPAAWGEICRKGRHHTAQVYAITQRPAESDKTILGNAAVVHCGRMAYPRDRAYMSEVLEVPAADIAKLQPLEWIERDMRTLQVSRGKVRFG